LAILITFAFAGRMEDTGIDQVCKYSVQIILVLVASFDGTADLIQAELGDKRLQEEISTIEKPLLILCDACSLSNIHLYFSIFLIVEFCLFFCLVFGPSHQSICITVELI